MTTELPPRPSTVGGRRSRRAPTSGGCASTDATSDVDVLTAVLDGEVGFATIGPTPPWAAPPSPRHPTARGGRACRPCRWPSDARRTGAGPRAVFGPAVVGAPSAARPAPTSRCCRTTPRRQGSTSRWASPPSTGPVRRRPYALAACGWPPGTSTRSAPASTASPTGWSAPTSTCWPCRRPSAPTTQFPTMPFAALGYDVAHVGFNQWNGVAIASRVGLEDVADRVRRAARVE